MLRFGFRQVAILISLSSTLLAGQAEDDDYPPGLLARYTAGGKDIERVDPDVQFAWGDQGLTGEVRTTFVEALMRSCLKTQLDAPTNKDVPVSALYDYCKCNASGMADKTSNDEVKTLEATGSEEKYRTAMQTRMESSAKTCLDEIRKSLPK